MHDAYIRLVDVDKAQHWDSSGHFFAAAARAMRRILVDDARRKNAEKRGGDWQRVTLEEAGPVAQATRDDLLLLNEMLQELAENDALRTCFKIALRMKNRYSSSGLSTFHGRSYSDVLHGLSQQSF